MSSTDDKAARFLQLLLDMKKEYLSSLPLKVILIRELTSQKKWKELHDEYHKLKGTGKTYGFPEVSIICQILETLSAKNPEKQIELFQKAPELLDRMLKTYQQDKAFSLEQDDFARSLLALKSK